MVLIHRRDIRKKSEIAVEEVELDGCRSQRRQVLKQVDNDRVWVTLNAPKCTSILPADPRRQQHEP